MAQSQHLEANYPVGSPVSFPCNIGLLPHGPFPPPAKLNILCYPVPSRPRCPCAGPAYISGSYSQFLKEKKNSRIFCEITFKIKCSPATFLECLF